ncbi:MAG: YhdP family protein, partial [Alphaproteobacteria bacterium]
QASVRAISVPRIAELWPQGAAANARAWVVRNIRHGQIENADMQIAAFVSDKEPDGMRLTNLTGNFAFADLEIDYFRPLPPVRGVTGTASFDLERIDFSVTGGGLEGLTVEEADVRITGIEIEDERIAIDAVLRGGLADALAVLDQPPLKLIAGYGIDPGKTSGELAARVAFRFPLLSDLRLSQVEIAAAANARAVALPGPATELDIADGDLTLQLDGKGMEVVGTARVGPALGQVSWRESFDPGAVIRGRYGFSGVLDGAARAAFGLNTAPYLEGPVEADLIYTLGEDDQASLAVAVNLVQTSLELPELGWRKAAGIAGSARARIDFRDGRPTVIREFNVLAGDLTATGNARFGSEGRELAEIRFERIAFGHTDIAGSARARADGGFDLDIGGPSFDAAPIIHGEGDGEGSDRPFAVNLRVERVWIGEKESIETVTGRMVHDGTDWREIELEGRLAGEELTVRLVPEDGRRALAVRAGDAGAVFKAIGITDKIRGGQIEIAGYFDDRQPGSPLAARAEAKNFRLIKAPIMTKLLSIASITAPLALLEGEGINFTRLEAPFRLVGDRLEIGKSRAYGNALGVTGEGRVDLAAETIDMKGTVVPAYTVNRVLGAIPIVGTLLTGGEGEGVFAVNYGVSGSLDNPKVSVNPLSVLAPGFLRNLFGILEGGKGEPPTVREND